MQNHDSELKLLKLRKLFPECVSTKKDDCGNVSYEVDFDKLRLELGFQETYSFSWVGKRAALQEALCTTHKRLCPSKRASKNWDRTQNVYIEGDNIDALKLLRKDYAQKVDAIYIDPPYNTGNNTFVYNDDFSRTSAGTLDLHSNWCSTFYSRLLLSRDLLTDSGAIFVSIDDCEYANAVKILDEVYGRDNFVATIVWNSKREAKGIPPKNMCVKNHEYIICYSKDGSYRFVGELRNVEDGFSNSDGDPRGPWKRQYLQRFGQGFAKRTIVDPQTGRSFRFETPYTQEKLERWIAEGRVIFPDSSEKFPARKEYFYEYKNPYKPIVTSWGLFSTKVGSEKLKRLFGGQKVFDYAKPLDLLTTLLRRAVGPNALILDFFAGSGTLGHAVMALNAEDGGSRRFILVQAPESCGRKSDAYKLGYCNISEICRERLRLAGEELIVQTGNVDLDVGFRSYTIK